MPGFPVHHQLPKLTQTVNHLHGTERQEGEEGELKSQKKVNLLLKTLFAMA